MPETGLFARRWRRRSPGRSFYAVAVFAFMKREKTLTNLIRYSLAGYLAYFIFNTGVHENHLFLAAILSSILCWQDRSHAIRDDDARTASMPAV
jgi:heme/copper-type cytochrome/quinol oxidase subunit 3